jgi:hypothetical protein
MRYIRSLGVLAVMFAIAVVYLATSGVKPEDTNLFFEIALALVAGSVFVFFERLANDLLGMDESSELKSDIRDLHDKVDSLTEEISRLNKQLEGK